MTQHMSGTWKAIDIEIYEIDDLGNPGSFLAMARDQRVAAWMADTHNSMLAALKAILVQIHDYELINNLASNPGRKECWDCVEQGIAAIAKAEGTKP